MVKAEYEVADSYWHELWYYTWLTGRLSSYAIFSYFAKQTPTTLKAEMGYMGWEEVVTMSKRLGSVKKSCDRFLARLDLLPVIQCDLLMIQPPPPNKIA